MLLNQKFGRLFTIEKIRTKMLTRYKCICDCGNEVMVKHSNLQSGHTKSCGCLSRETSSINGLNNFKHGQSTNRTKEYHAWKNMKVRCYNKNFEDYHHYGGRGIKVCERWLNDFQAFLDDVGKAPGEEYSIDRIDNDGHYEPRNVRWATKSEQTSNRSTSKHIFI